MKEKDQTFISFRDKWEKNAQLAFSETLKEGSDIFQWIINRNGFKSPDELRIHLSSKKRILDAGCGNGRVTALLHRYVPSDAEVVGIDLTAAHVARENLAGLDRVSIFQKDLLGDLNDLGFFDFIYCQEVLHHTADPRKSFINLCQRLAPCGEIAIYVYKLKAPLREYADDYIRDAISPLHYGDAMREMQEITQLGKTLSELDVKVNVPEVKVLGIEAGEYDIQRFIYHFFLKCFWNPSLGFDENVAINYDWYHPQLCTRHTLAEVEEWFADAGLEVVHRCVDHYGITVRGIKPV
jgi:SAM-dependent methyltransferase